MYREGHGHGALRQRVELAGSASTEALPEVSGSGSPGPSTTDKTWTLGSTTLVSRAARRHRGVLDAARPRHVHASGLWAQVSYTATSRAGRKVAAHRLAEAQLNGDRDHAGRGGERLLAASLCVLAHQHQPQHAVSGLHRGIEDELSRTDRRSTAVASPVPTRPATFVVVSRPSFSATPSEVRAAIVSFAVITVTVFRPCYRSLVGVVSVGDHREGPGHGQQPCQHDDHQATLQGDSTLRERSAAQPVRSMMDRPRLGPAIAAGGWD